MLQTRTQSPLAYSRKGVSKGKLTQPKALGKRVASRYSSFLPLMHREVIYHNANTEKLLGTSPVLLILTYSFLDHPSTLHVTRRGPSYITVVLDSDKDLPKAPQRMLEFPLD